MKADSRTKLQSSSRDARKKFSEGNQSISPDFGVPNTPYNLNGLNNNQMNFNPTAK
jgi:hypothetical protein